LARGWALQRETADYQEKPCINSSPGEMTQTMYAHMNKIKILKK
jgi:hypothetical protein